MSPDALAERFEAEGSVGVRGHLVLVVAGLPGGSGGDHDQCGRRGTRSEECLRQGGTLSRRAPTLPPGLTGGGDQDVADYLRANGLVIVYLGPEWILEQRQPVAAPTALPPGGTQLAFPM